MHKHAPRNRRTQIQTLLVTDPHPHIVQNRPRSSTNRFHSQVPPPPQNKTINVFPMNEQSHTATALKIEKWNDRKIYLIGRWRFARKSSETARQWTFLYMITLTRAEVRNKQKTICGGERRTVQVDQCITMVDRFTSQDS